MDAKYWLMTMAVLLVAACGGGSSGPVPASSSGSLQGAPGSVDAQLQTLIAQRGLDGNPADGLVPVAPADSAMVNLGMTLFFSRTLSGGFDVACASCHQPRLGGGDGLTLPIGVAAARPEVVGLGRVLDADADLSARSDGGPNVPRNSQTIFNSALYDRALFHDGRVFVLEEDERPGGAGQSIRTPESGNVPDPQAGGSLLEAQSLFPLTSNDEMRGYRYPELVNPEQYRAHLVDRLRGDADQAWLSAGAADRWEAAFESVFGAAGLFEQPITLARVQRALAAYQASQVFTDTPWRDYVEGNPAAVGEAAKRGALLFYSDKGDGGLGCAGCHAGDHLTNESFYNVAFPQIGRGKRADGSDHGRGEVNINTRTDADSYAFRVPSLVNVALTGPYAHAGTFAGLDDAIAYHANPRDALAHFDFSLMSLPQAQLAGVDGRTIYPDALTLTEAAIEAPSFAIAEALLPGRALTADEIADLVAFLEALTDRCAASADCVDQWLPDESNNPDGNMLVVNQGFSVPPVDSGPYASSQQVSYPALAPAQGFSDMKGCSANLSASNTGSLAFIERGAALNVDIEHGFSLFTWLGDNLMSPRYIMPTMLSGGLAFTYLDDDCWLDLVLAGGDKGGTRLLINQGQQNGFADTDMLAGPVGTRYASVGVADINGDYRREVFLGNLRPGAVAILSQNASGGYEQVGSLPMDRNSFGFAFSPLQDSGFPDVYVTHWGEAGLPGRAPVLWWNDGGGTLTVADEDAGVSESELDQRFQFSPAFVDMDADGDQDMLVASDFGTSLVLQNAGGQFTDVTDRSVVTDEFGMGSAVADFDNDGRQDWFVTSIAMTEPGEDDAFCTQWTGNRLYRNTTVGSSITLEDITEQSGVREGGWGWGACAADFNNDGLTDIYHVNGMNELPLLLDTVSGLTGLRDNLCLGFGNSPARLFINRGNAVFEEQAADWGLGFAEDGRGVSCGDYDRDGDVDIGVLNHSDKVLLMENQSGAGPGRSFVNIRLEGAAPNTEALGAEVIVEADLDGDGDIAADERQTKINAANSNYASQSAPEMHFGLGQASVIARITIRWPGADGLSLECTDVGTRAYLVFSQRQGDGVGVCP